MSDADKESKPSLIVICACDKGMNLELDYGKRVQYTGLKSAQTMANIFRYCHRGQYCEVTEKIVDPRL